MKYFMALLFIICGCSKATPTLEVWSGPCDTKEKDKKFIEYRSIQIGDLPHPGKCFEIRPKGDKP